MPPEDQSANSVKYMVDPAGLAVSRDVNVSLCTSPLGACLGIAIYDPAARVGGLLHSLLPASKLDPKRAASRPGMFLDTGLAALLAEAEKLNAKRENIRIFVAGGAQMMDETGVFNIGKLNTEILGELLPRLGVKVYARQAGGRTSCSMELTLATGEVRLRFSGQAAAKTLCKPSKIT